VNVQQQVWLFRHGETAWSLTGQHSGRKDLPLLPEAEAKLTALKPFLQHPFAQVLCSPLQRARQTAQLLGFETVEIDANLMEWNYGNVEGKTWEEMQKSIPGWSLWTHGAGGGETLEAVAQRARAVITRVQAVSGDVALVAHGHFLKILTTCWLGLPPAAAEHLALSTASVSILTYEHESPVIARWNWRPGLARS